MSRFAGSRRTFFIEEPAFENVTPHLRLSICPRTGVRVYTPVLRHGLTRQQILEYQTNFLQSTLNENRITEYIAWYYTPMALEFTGFLSPVLTVYDCMDELSAFAGAPPAMRHNEAALFEKADLVFTGGASLFESKRKQHPSVHSFPSSVDFEHFSQARGIQQDPEDQAHIPHPRLGYAGVIDERMDLELLREMASVRPDWQLVLLGPVVKIDPASLPRAANIHYLGMKKYSELPGYFGGWDLGMLPFALNSSTQFISPTKTPEYLAAGLRVVSTPIRDVVTPYGDLGLVQIGNGTREFLRAVNSLLESPLTVELRNRIDRFLAQSSWDKTWDQMNALLEEDFVLKRTRSANHRGLASRVTVAESGSNV